MKTLIPLVLIASILLTHCGVGDLENQVATLTSYQSLLNSEKDSLIRLIALKSDTLKAREVAYHNLNSDKTELEAKTKALQSLLNARTKQLSNAQATSAKRDSDFASESAKNDSLMKEISILKRKIADIDSKMEHEVKENVALNESLKQESEKRKADSISFANAPKQEMVRYGFVHSGEIGAGIGLGDTDADYAARFISLDYVLGYRLSKSFIAGAGTGISFYNGGTIVPLYADLRYHFRGKQYAPFIAGDGGILFTLDKLSNSGIFLNPQIGIIRILNEKMRLNLSTGLYIQQAPAGERNAYVNIKGGFSFGK